MNSSIRYILIFLLITTFSTSLLAQRKRIERADQYYNSGEYFKAKELYIKAYSRAKDKSSRGKIAFKIGQCSRKINDPRGSRKWYQKAVYNKYQNPRTKLYLADALKMLEQYEDAKKYYADYKDLVPDDPDGELGVSSCDLAMEWMEKPSRWQVESIRYFNSRESDFAPRYGSDSSEIYFTSSRESSTGDEMNDNSGMYFTDIFYTKRDKKGKWSEPIPVEGAVNTAFDEGAAYITPNGRTMYYTSCKSIKNQSLGCKIFMSNKNGTKWSAPEQIEIFKDSSISVGHPYLSHDQLILYFVTENQDGIGGKDIWFMKRNSKSAAWGKPQNMGEPINTKKDEMYPFIRKDGTFYFASNGHIGMGGLDIFTSKKDENGKWIVENMKYPINSNADDFGIVMHDEDNVGYFCSSRVLPKSDDIYYFWQPPLKISVKGIVKNADNNVVIPNAKIKMTGTDGTQIETTADDNGLFFFDLREKTDYLFVSSKPPRYLKGVARETTKGIKEDKVLEIELFMTKTNVVVEIENIEYDFGKATLREESKVALDKLVELLEINNNITIELRANTDFRGNETDNMDLSERRAQSVINYLISKGIKSDRLVAKGLGESNPIKVSKKQANKYPFLTEGDILSEEFIKNLETDQEREIAHQLNRRTEFKVLRTDYKEGGIPFGTHEDNK